MTGLDGGGGKLFESSDAVEKQGNVVNTVPQTEAPYVDSERMLSGCVTTSMKYEKAKAVISLPPKHM